MAKKGKQRTGGRKSTSAPAADGQRVRQMAQQAVALANRGDLAGALTTIEQCVRLDPRDPELLHLGGQLAIDAGQVGRGIAFFREAIKRVPKSAALHYNLGSALAMQDDLDAALESYQRALRLDPRDPDLFVNMGILQVRRHHTEDAERAFSEAARLQPDNPQIHLNRALCNLELRRPAQVEAALARIERLVPQPDAALLHQIGNIHRGLGRSQLARRYYERALKQQPEAPEILFALADVLSRGGDNSKALEVMQRLRDAGFDLNFVNPAMARILANLGQMNAARALLAEATQGCGEDVDSLLRIAREYALIGEFALQEQILRKVLTSDPDNTVAFLMMNDIDGRQIDGRDLQKLVRLLKDPSVDAEIRTRLGFSLGDHYRRAGEYDTAFDCYRLGNQLKGYSFDRAGYAEWVDKMASTATPAFFSERRSWGNTSRLPVLIVGMPRSGTTLTEQILCSHPELLGAGEYGRVSDLCALPELPVPDLHLDPTAISGLDQSRISQHAAAYLDRMARVNVAGAKFVSNKLPHNFEELGLFALLFPEAPIVHIKRDPPDNLLSIYFHDFSGTHDYAYDLASLGHYYRLYERLMAHWADAIPNPVMTLQYEDLVADLPGKAKALADFVGLAFDERMLRFHEQDRLVATASRQQVRQPIYSSSIARWKPYESHLGAMFDALRESE